MTLKSTILVLFIAYHGRMTDVASGACTGSTCLNGGTCDSSYTGSGFKCKCPTVGDAADYGPRCELGIRGYSTTLPSDSDTKYAITKHNLSGHPLYPNKHVITFDIVAHCYKPPCRFFEIKDINSISLVTVELFQKLATTGFQHYYLVYFPFDKKDPLYYIEKVDHHALPLIWEPIFQDKHLNQHWQSFTISFYWKTPPSPTKPTVTIKLQLCSLKIKECFRTQIDDVYYPGDLAARWKGSTLSIGRFTGCIRFPRVNGELVDLGNVIGYEGGSDRAFTQPFCPFFKSTCQKFDGVTQVFQQNYCGKDSQCDGDVGRIGARNAPTVSCNCQCINGKRRLLETVSNSHKCTNSPEPSNECNIESPTLSTGPTNFNVEWKMQNDEGIKLGGKNHLSLVATFKTREMNCEKAFELLSNTEAMPHINIFNGLLYACFKNRCHAFPNVSVSDGEWHSFSLSIWNEQLTAMLNMVTEKYEMGGAYDYTRFTSARLVLSLPNSCVRAIRLANIYLPTGDSDVTADDNVTFIKVIKGSGVEINAARCMNSLVITSPVTNPVINVSIPSVTSAPLNRSIKCTQCNGLNQQCRIDSGMQRCECIDGFVFDSKGNCIASIQLIRSLITESSDHASLSVLVAVFTAACHLIHILW